MSATTHAAAHRAAADFIEQYPNVNLHLGVSSSSARFTVQITKYDNGSDRERLAALLSVTDGLGIDRSRIQVVTAADLTEYVDCRGMWDLVDGVYTAARTDGPGLSWTELLLTAVAA